MNLAISNAWKHPRSTILGVAGTLTGGYFLVMNDPDYAMLKAMIPVRWAGRLASAALIIGLVLRVASKDTGREESNTAGGKKMVDSTETPVVGAAVKPE